MSSVYCFFGTQCICLFLPLREFHQAFFLISLRFVPFLLLPCSSDSHRAFVLSLLSLFLRMMSVTFRENRDVPRRYQQRRRGRPSCHALLCPNVRETNRVWPWMPAKFTLWDNTTLVLPMAVKPCMMSDVWCIIVWCLLHFGKTARTMQNRQTMVVPSSSPNGSTLH